MRISDWSSDVCCSDLGALPHSSGRVISFPGFGETPVGRDEPLNHCRDQPLWRGRALGLAATHRDSIGGKVAVQTGIELNGQTHRLLVGKVGELQRSEEHTSELQSLMRISYAVFCLKQKK